MFPIEERVNKIYSKYINIITEQINRYETLMNSFPIGILNEIRAVFTHLARASFLSDGAKEKQIEKAEGHITRAIRDCYKYNCLAIEDKYKEFMSLKAVSEEDRLYVFSLHEKAIDALFLARRMENSIDSYNNSDEIDAKYGEAYQFFDELHNKIRDITN